MRRDFQQSCSLILLLTGQVLTRPAWLMALFLFLVCLVPFAGGNLPFRGDAFQMLDPFSFSLLTPSVHAFGPHSILALSGLILIPSLLIFWRRNQYLLENNCTSFGLEGGILPASALFLYSIFLILSLPLISRSSAFPTVQALGITLLDLFLLAANLALFTDYALSRTRHPRLQPLIAWIVAAAIYLARCMTDTFIISPQAMEIVEADWTLVAWHTILVLIALTLYAFPGTATRTRATI